MKTQSAIINPYYLPDNLNVAEQKFVEYMAKGTPCRIGSGKRPLEKNNGQGAPNVIRAGVIRFFAWGGDETNKMRGIEINLQGAWVSESLILNHANIPYTLAFTNCHFNETLIMRHARCRFLNMAGSRLGDGLLGDGLRIENNLFMRGNFSARGEVRLINAEIGKIWDCSGGEFANQKESAIVADGVRVGGGAFLRNLSAVGAVHLSDSHVGGSMHCDHSKFENAEGHAIIADRIRVNGNLFLNDEFSAAGTVRLSGANIGGDLRCNDGKFKKVGGNALTANRVKVNGNLFLDNGFSAEGSVRLSGSDINGDLKCDGGTFIKEADHAIIADGIRVGGNLSMQKTDIKQFSSKGEVKLVGSNIAGDLYCDGGIFSNKGGNALNADGINVNGGVFMRNAFRAEGQVRLLGANIGKILSCYQGTFYNHNKESIFADQAKIGGNAALTSACVQGKVRLNGINIDGDLSCQGATFSHGLSAKGAHIHLSLILRNTKGSGTINLGFATADVLSDDEQSREGFNFSLDGFSYARFAAPATNKSRIKWLTRRPKIYVPAPRWLKQVPSILSAMANKISHVKRWVKKIGYHPHTLEWMAIALHATARRIRSKGWPLKSAPFTPQPFEQAAKALFAMGDNNNAREILLTKERLLTREGKLPLRRKFARRWLWDFFGGYGYQLRRPILWTMGVILAGAYIFNMANENHYIAPHQPVVIAYKDYMQSQAGGRCVSPQPTKVVECLFPEYPPFNALLFSVDVFIPFFALHQEQYWYPLPIETDGFFGRWMFVIWHWIEIVAGWIFTSLLVLSITGLLRPRLSSGGE